MGDEGRSGRALRVFGSAAPTVPSRTTSLPGLPCSPGKISLTVKRLWLRETLVALIFTACALSADDLCGRAHDSAFGASVEPVGRVAGGARPSAGTLGVELYVVMRIAGADTDRRALLAAPLLPWQPGESGKGEQQRQRARWPGEARRGALCPGSGCISASVDREANACNACVRV